jgi:protein-disulfide isomerase
MYWGHMEGKKSLIFSTLAIALSLFSSAVIYQTMRTRPPVVVQAERFPSIGKSSAPIEVVLIEDFQCKNCRVFSQKIIPKIKSHYVDSGKVRFTLVPVSFLAGSQAIANAALEVYRQNPTQFFTYLKDVLIHEGPIKSADLVRLARRLQGINLAQLENCIATGCHNQELENNLRWAMGIMGDQFRTPALYINGSPGSTYSFEAIQYQVEQILAKP